MGRHPTPPNTWHERARCQTKLGIYDVVSSGRSSIGTLASTKARNSSRVELHCCGASRSSRANSMRVTSKAQLVRRQDAGSELF